MCNTPTTATCDTDLQDTFVVGVKSLDIFQACYSCAGKVVQTFQSIGECTRFNTTQRLSSCKRHSATLDLQTQHGTKRVSVSSPCLEDICSDNVSKEALITSVPFKAIVSVNNIILSISRQILFQSVVKISTYVFDTVVARSSVFLLARQTSTQPNSHTKPSLCNTLCICCRYRYLQMSSHTYSMPFHSTI